MAEWRINTNPISHTLSCDIAGPIFFHDQFRQNTNGSAWLRMFLGCSGEYFLANLRSGRLLSFAQLPRWRKTHGVHVSLVSKGAFKKGLSGKTSSRIQSGILQITELTREP